MSSLPEIFSRIEGAKQRAVRLAARNDAATNAIKKRDDTLFALFHDLHGLDNELRKFAVGKALKKLRARFGAKLTDDSARTLVTLTFPNLDVRTRTKYAATLRYIRKKKKPNQKVRTLVRMNGGINGCVKAEKKLRTASENRRQRNLSRTRSR
jgi:hypothetical protein